MPLSRQIQHARRYILLAVGLSFLLTFIGCLAFVREVNHLLNVSQKQESIQAVIQILENCLDDLQDMETGQRGFLLTGKADYLVPYYTGKDRLQEDLGNLQSRLSISMPENASLGKNLANLAYSKDAELLKTIRLYKDGQANQATALVNSNEGKNIMDEIRSLVGHHVSNYGKQLSVMKNEQDRHLSTAKFAFLFWICSIGAFIASALWNAFSSQRLLNEASIRLKNQAMHDPLTGLANRRYLTEWLQLTFASSHRSGQRLAALYIDLDGFGEINNKLGHDAGDMALMQASKVFKENLRESDFIARLGGDEFVIVCSNQDNHQLAQFAQRLITLLRSLFPGDGLSTGALSASIGIAVAPEDAANAEELVQKADKAMYEAKKAGRGCFRFNENLT